MQLFHDYIVLRFYRLSILRHTSSCIESYDPDYQITNKTT